MNLFIKRALLSCFRIYLRAINTLGIGLYHLKRSVMYTARNFDRNSWNGKTRVSCHIIEKGLTMPNTRYRFGQSHILALIEHLDKSRQYASEQDYIYAVALLKEFKEFHERNKQRLSKSFENILDNFLSEFSDVEPLHQITISRNDYFSYSDASFPILSKARKSVRYFEGPIDFNEIREAVDMAKTAPSACNRQAIKVHYFEGEIVQNILELHTGNRGFGHTIPQVLVLCEDVSMLGSKEYNDAYTNAGIFAMNLSYALYYKKIVSCILNWSVPAKQDKLLRKLIKIPNQETIIMIIALGNAPDEIKVAVSNRECIDDLLVVH